MKVYLIPVACQKLSKFSPTSLQGMHYYPYFTDDEIEAQRSYLTNLYLINGYISIKIYM